MAQLVISAAGAAIGGAFFGAPALGWAIGSAIGAAAFPTKTEGPRLSDLRVSGTEYGQVIPWVAGSPRISGQIIWASQKRETGTTQSQGKGGGPEYTTYTYDVDILYLLSENEIAGISKVWLNGDLVYDGITTRGGVWSDIRVLTGASDQLPDPTYEAAVGSANAPAYRTRGCVLIQGLQLGQSGQIPNLTFEIGTPEIKNYTDVIYCFRPNGTNPSWVDASIYGWSVSYTSNTGTTLPVDDGVLQLGGETSGYATLDGGGGDFADHYGDFTVEFDFNIDWAAFWFTGFAGRKLFTIGNDNLHLFIRPQFTLTGVTFSGLFSFGTGCEQISYSASTSPLDIYSTSDIWNRWVTVTSIRKGPIFQLWIDNELMYEKDYTGTAFYDGINEVFTTPINLAGTHYLGQLNQGGISRVRNFRFAKADLYASQVTGPYIKPVPLSNFYTVTGAGQKITETLEDTVSDLMVRSGYTASDYDVASLSTITKPVRALAISQNGNTRAILETLQSAYFFEVAKSDKIYFHPRASSPVATIDYDDLATRGDISEDVEPFALKFANDLETPAQVSVSFNNMEADYQIGTEYSDRLISGQESVTNVQIPLGFTSAEGKGIADAILLDQIASQNSATITLPLEYAYLEPSDVVTIQTPDRSYRARLVTKKESNGIIEFDLVLDDANALESAEITDSDYPTQPTVQQIASTLWEALDIPLLRDADNTPGFYVAVKPDTDGDLWPGAGFFSSWDDVSYANLLTFSSRATFGTCTTTLGDWTGGNRFDETNTLTVNVGAGTLSSSTRSAMLNDLTINVMVVGSELIRFRTATLVSTGVYTLSGLIRGFRGTEWAIGGHVASERCILLDSAVLRSVSQTSELNLLRYIKAVTSGFTLGSAISEQFTDTGVCLKPFSVANPRALASGSDVVVTWDRRTRLSYVYGGTSPTVPLGEAFERYRIRVYDGSNLVRTEEVSDAQTFTYTAAMISADGFASTNVATFEIVQLSEIIGEGYPAEVEGIIP